MSWLGALAELGRRIHSVREARDVILAELVALRIENHRLTQLVCELRKKEAMQEQTLEQSEERLARLRKVVAGIRDLIRENQLPPRDLLARLDNIAAVALEETTP